MLARTPRARTAALAAVAFAAALTAVSAYAQAPAAPAPAEAPDLPEVVAKVNEQPIHRKELLTQAELLRSQMVRSGGADPVADPAFYRDVLEGLIGEALVYQAAKRSGDGATQEAVAEAIAGIRGNFPDDAAFEAELARQGIDRQGLEEQIEATLSVQRYIELKVAPAVTISEEEKRAFYDGNLDQMKVPERRKVRHILFRAAAEAPEEAKQQARGRAQAILTQIREGGDFAALAKQSSEDEGSKEQGGELGWVVQSGRLPRFEAAVFSLAPGAVSEVVETGGGYHVIELLEIKPAGVQAFEEVAPQIERYLRDRRLQQEVQRRVESLKGTASIEVLI